MTIQTPRVTVAMPLYNGASTVARAIDSILQQTFTDFELVLVDDGCSDNTIDIVRSYDDPRIRLITHETNQGLAATRNHLVDQARGEFIAWLDQDDWSHPERLARQVARFSTNPQLGLSSSWTQAQTANGKTNRVTEAASRLQARVDFAPEMVRATQLFGNTIATSSAMLRISLLKQHGLAFRESYAPSEDYDMWSRVGLHSQLDMIPRVLTKRWEHPAGASRLGAERQRIGAEMVRRDLLDEMRMTYGNAELAIHQTLATPPQIQPLRPDPHAALDWLARLAQSNKTALIFDPRALRTITAGIVAREAFSAANRGDARALRVLMTSDLIRAAPRWVAGRAAAMVGAGFQTR